MRFSQLKKYAVKHYYPALFLEKIISHKKQQKTRKMIGILVLLFGVASVVMYVASHIGYYPLVIALAPRAYGIFFMLLSLWMIAAALQAFYYT